MINPIHRSKACLILLAASLSACAAAAPGFSPDPPAAANKMLPTMQSGSVEKGTYQPSDDEKKLDCRKLTGSMHVMLSRLKDAPNRPRPSGMSTAIQGAAAPVFKGSTIGMDFEGELLRERLRLDAYNKLLGEKKCKTMDVGAELKKPR
jgi:hypothetical protein